jgi:GrpB-like predicted nucleotidyltransferase (UPF0157 family)
MVKNIGDLSEDQLGRLFPIEIISYNENWKILFQQEKKIISETLGNEVALRLEHFGSTAVKGLASKPTIDILVEVPDLTVQVKTHIIERMKSIGYDFIWRTDDKEPYMMFAKGYTLEGIKGQTFHVHMAHKRHALWDRLFFRDYLTHYPGVAKEYESLKLELAKKYKYNREYYTKAKTEFISKVTAIAKQRYIETKDCR